MQRTKRQAKEERRQENEQAAQRAGMESLDGGALVALLGDKHGLIRAAAMETLLARGRAAIPYLLAGLSHSSSKIRASCALLLDHVADDTCVEPLLQAIRHDPVEAVRRCALHSLVCDGCKECPLTADAVPALLEVTANDRSLAVRRRAVFYLSMQRPDSRVAPFLQTLLACEKDPILLRRTHNALQRHQQAFATI